MKMKIVKSQPKQAWYRHLSDRNRKNQLFFYRKLLSDRMFYARLVILLEKYGGFKNPNDASNLLYSFIDPTKRYQLGSIKEQTSLIKKALRTLEGWREKKGIELFDEIEYFLKISNLGFEWTSSLIALVLEHGLCLPCENLYIETSRDDDAPRRVILTLNPDTSPDDIKFSFYRIKKLQKKLQPDFKPINLNKYALGRFYEVMYYDLAKYAEALKESREQLDPYERSLFDSELRRHSIEEAVKKINKTGYESRMRNPRFQFRLSDRSVARRVAAAMPEGNVQRILNNMRQKRKRQKV